MQDVQIWLSKKPHNYEEGVRIYLQYNRTPLYLALFKEQETPFKREKLIELMTELSKQGSPEEKPANTPTAPPAIQVVTRDRQGWPENITDPVLAALKGQAGPLYAEFMNLKARIYEVALQGEQGNTAKENEAGQMAHRILDLNEQLLDLYRERDYFLQNGRLPDMATAKDPVVDPVRWATELQNAKRYVREYVTKLKKHPTDKKAVKWAQKLKDFEAEVARLSKLLKLDDGKG